MTPTPLAISTSGPSVSSNPSVSHKTISFPERIVILTAAMNFVTEVADGFDNIS